MVVEPPQFELTRAAYDATADVYSARIGTEISATIEGAVDRALLAAFVELVGPSASGLIADIGCGPGRVAAFLAARGLRVIGVDPSRGMLAVATAAHPHLRFEEGALDHIPVADGSLAGAVCWYSIIHTPPEHLPAACQELARALSSDGRLLLAFQAGHGEAVHRTSVAGRPVSLTSYHHDPHHVAGHLERAGFHVTTRAVRDAAGAHETTPQAFLLAERSARPAR